MIRPLHPVWLILSVPSVSTGLWAQQDPVLERGSQIEIVSERLAGGIADGWLETLTKDSLTFVNSSGTTAVALEDIGQLRVNIGRDGAALNAATVAGALLGVGLAPIVSPESFNCRYGIQSDLRGDDECDQEVPKEVVGAIAGAFGLRMLMLVGLGERWMNVRLDHLIYVVRDPERM